jgi:hypothetical protein
VAGNIKYNIIVHKPHNSTNNSKLIISARSKTFKRWSTTITDAFSVSSTPVPTKDEDLHNNNNSHNNDNNAHHNNCGLNNFSISVFEMYNLLDDAVHKRNNNLVVSFPEIEQVCCFYFILYFLRFILPRIPSVIYARYLLSSCALFICCLFICCIFIYIISCSTEPKTPSTSP